MSTQELEEGGCRWGWGEGQVLVQRLCCCFSQNGAVLQLLGAFQSLLCLRAGCEATSSSGMGDVKP